MRRRPFTSESLPELQPLVLSGRVETLRRSIELLIVAATDVERDAVLRRMTALRARPAILHGTIGPAAYYLGALGQHGAVLTVSRTATAGTDAGRSALAVACRDWTPRAVVMLGVAFGRDPEKQRVGDVLVASRILSGDEPRGGVGAERRPPVTEANETLLDRFRSVAGWSFPRGDGTSCVVQVGPVLAGDGLADDAAARAALFDRFPEALGGATDGRHLHAVAAAAGVPSILVQGIGCSGDGAAHDADLLLASAAASSLVADALSPADALDGLPRSDPRPPVSSPRAPREQADPSSARGLERSADSRRAPSSPRGWRSTAPDSRGGAVKPRR